MKLFNPFYRNPYATLNKIQRIINREARKFGLEVRKDNQAFIISTDRADVGVFLFDMYARSFDVQAMDAFGANCFYPVSIVGQMWKDTLESKVRFAMFKMYNAMVPNGVRVNLKWMNMVKELNSLDDETIKDIGDGQAYFSPQFAKALAYMSVEKNPMAGAR